LKRLAISISGLAFAFLAFLSPLSALASGPNLINNPSAETLSGSNPVGWLKGSWGSNTPQFSVSSGGHSGSRSLMLKITSYSSGDAKWYFQHVAVEPSTHYTFSDYYKASVGTGLTAEVIDTAGQYSYLDLGGTNASSNWSQATASFTTPANAQKVSVFHTLSAVGTLQTDDFSLTKDTVTPPPPPPPPTGNIVPNPSMETPDPASASRPQYWSNNKWGTNTAQFSYLNTGHSGSHSVRTQVTSYTNGDAKWSFASQPVSPNTTYTFSDYYQSTANCDVAAIVTDSSGGSQYIYLGSSSPSSGWSKFQREFTTPANATSVTIIHALISVGTLTVDDYSVTPYTPVGFNGPLVSLTFDDAWRDTHDYGLPIMQSYGFKTTQYMLTGVVGDPSYMTTAMMQDFKNNGHEIASHTIDHLSLPPLSSTEIDRQLRESKASLQAWTGAPVTNFASPYGDYNDSLLANIKLYYRSHRTVNTGFNSKTNFDPYQLKVQNITNTTTAAQIQQWMNQAKAEKSWLILVYHRVDPSTSLGTYSTTPAALTTHFDVIKNSGVPVVTVDQALNQLIPQL
jgi:peptidoglycan/xylan/chitin deacetylase (PgdA/CDA1 family)